MRRRNYHHRGEARTGFSIFIVVIILAVAAGYAGTKYIIYPYLLGNNPIEDSKEQTGETKTATEAAVDVITSPPSVIIDKQNLQNDTASDNKDPVVVTAGNGPFSVQFGSFSSKTGADALSAELTGKGIYSYVLENDGSYKVLGLPYTTKEKATEAATVVSAVVSDVFVVDISNLIP